MLIDEINCREMRNKFVQSLAEDYSSMLAALKENSQIFGSHLEKAIKSEKKIVEAHLPSIHLVYLEVQGK